MRVICINAADMPFDDLPKPVKGNVYTVLSSTYWEGDKLVRGDYRPIKGNYYKLVETGGKAAYHESCFVTINEDQQDETTFERNYQTETHGRII